MPQLCGGLSELGAWQEQLLSKAPMEHTHAIEQVNNLKDTLYRKAATDHVHEIIHVGGALPTLSLTRLSTLEARPMPVALLSCLHGGVVAGLVSELNKRALKEHTHRMSEVESLRDTFESKCDKEHEHAMSEVDGLIPELRRFVKHEQLEMAVGTP